MSIGQSAGPGSKAGKVLKASRFVTAKSVDELINPILADPLRIKQCNEDARQVRIKRKMVTSPKTRALILARNQGIIISKSQVKVLRKRLLSAKNQRAKIEENVLLSKFVKIHKQVIKQKCVSVYNNWQEDIIAAMRRDKRKEKRVIKTWALLILMKKLATCCMRLYRVLWDRKSVEKTGRKKEG